MSAASAIAAMDTGGRRVRLSAFGRKELARAHDGIVARMLDEARSRSHGNGGRLRCTVTLHLRRIDEGGQAHLDAHAFVTDNAGSVVLSRTVRVLGPVQWGRTPEIAFVDEPSR
jgi:hypothetical protein